MPQIHPTALVDPNAELAESVVVGPFCIVERNVTIDDGTILQSSNRIMSGARIGKNCVFSHGTVIANIPQDLKFKGEESLAIIGDGTRIREFCTINRGTEWSGKTEIGANCFIMAYVHVAHDCVLGNNVVIANGVNMAGHVVIGDGATIGGMAAIHQFTHIGRNCMIAASIFLSKDIPPFTLAGKDPVSFEGLNSIGLRRKGFSREAIETLDTLYTILYRSGLNVSQAVEKIRAELPQIPEVLEVLTFIENSTRGIVRPRS